MQQDSDPTGSLPATLLYKIAPASLWAEAERAGSFVGAPVDLADGFVHLSTRAQVTETAGRHFAGQRDLVLAAFDAVALGQALRFEVSRGGDRFPHHYGPLPLAALRTVEPVADGPDGTSVLPLPPDPGDDDPRSRGWIASRTGGYVDGLGALWERPEAEGTAYAFRAGAPHLNRNGIVHGGCLMTFMDEAVGRTSAQATGGRRQATIQLDTHFVSAAREGEWIEARCRVVRVARSVSFLAGELTAEGRVVATASGIWKIAATAP